MGECQVHGNPQETPRLRRLRLVSICRRGEGRYGRAEFSRKVSLSIVALIRDLADITPLQMNGRRSSR